MMVMCKVCVTRQHVTSYALYDVVWLAVVSCRENIHASADCCWLRHVFYMHLPLWARMDRLHAAIALVIMFTLTHSPMLHYGACREGLSERIGDMMPKHSRQNCFAQMHVKVWVCCQTMPIIIESRWQQQSMGSTITHPSASFHCLTSLHYPELLRLGIYD